MYNADYFITKFEAIPDEKWAAGTLRNDRGGRCALGLCGLDDLYQIDNTNWPEELEAWPEEARALSLLFMKEFESQGVYLNPFEAVYRVNDSYSSRWGDTPKKRILNFLNEIKRNAKSDH